MTDIYELDGSRMQELAEAHVYLQEMLHFPDYYGRNLDALYDLLTEISGETFIWISESEKLPARLEQVFMEAMESNPDLTVILED